MRPVQWTKEKTNALVKIAKLAEKHRHGQRLNWLFATKECKKEVKIVGMDTLQLSKAWTHRKRIVAGLCMKCGKPNNTEGNFCKKCAKEHVKNVMKYKTKAK
jgi:hypothetical protein